MDIRDALRKSPSPDRADRDKPAIPKIGEPGTYEWDGNEGVINTPPTLERITTWDEYIRDAGLDPEEVEVIEPVNVRGWDAIKKEKDEYGDLVSQVVKMHYYRLNVRRRRPGPVIDDLLALIKKSRPAKRAVKPAADGATFVVGLGDFQLGKIDGDGAEGTVQRISDAMEASLENFKLLRKAGVPLSAVHLAYLGDCIEGFNSQNGANAWRTELTLTEQIKILRRLMFFSVELFAPETDQLSVVAVPGNHDEAVRFGNKGVTRYDDSFDTDALEAVGDALAQNPKAFGHVNIYTPEPDELTVTLETSGTILAHAHGHKFRNKPWDWWKGQHFGDQPVGEADVLLAGHLHHYIFEVRDKRTFIQVPAMESESVWYRHQKGERGAPGLLNMVVQDAEISHTSIVL